MHCLYGFCGPSWITRISYCLWGPSHFTLSLSCADKRLKQFAKRLYSVFSSMKVNIAAVSTLFMNYSAFYHFSNCWHHILFTNASCCSLITCHKTITLNLKNTLHGFYTNLWNVNKKWYRIASTMLEKMKELQAVAARAIGHYGQCPPHRKINEKKNLCN